MTVTIIQKLTTSWSRVLLRKPEVAQLLSKFPKKPRGSWQCPQKPITSPNYEPDESTPHSHTSYLK